MTYAKVNESNIGDRVAVPINGEEMQKDEQICKIYEVVKALKKVGDDDILGIDADGNEQEPMPKLLEFTDETAFIMK